MLKQLFWTVVIAAMIVANVAQAQEEGEGTPGEQPAVAEPDARLVQLEGGVRTATETAVRAEGKADKALDAIARGQGVSRPAVAERRSSSRTRRHSSGRRTSGGSSSSAYSAGMARLRTIAEEGRTQIAIVRGVIREEIRPRLSALEESDKAQDARLDAVEATAKAQVEATTALDTRVGEVQGDIARLEAAVGAKALKKAEARLAAAAGKPTAEGEGEKPEGGSFPWKAIFLVLAAVAAIGTFALMRKGVITTRLQAGLGIVLAVALLELALML